MRIFSQYKFNAELAWNTTRVEAGPYQKATGGSLNFEAFRTTGSSASFESLYLDRFRLDFWQAVAVGVGTGCQVDYTGG